MKLSVVINTLNRGASLDITLDSLSRLDKNDDFSMEVIVVNGPSIDNTMDIVKKWSDRIKFEKCDIANLSVSRNIGIAASSGDIVAFLDDDSVPESNWLIELSQAYNDKRVGAAGGPVFDFNGFDFQTKYETIDRFGSPNVRKFPEPQLCYPTSSNIPHLLGANCSFLKSALIEIGGFDETFEYFLDESDVLIRIVDLGYQVRQLPNSYVHHKSRESGLRNEKRVPTNRYPLIKNKIYFVEKHSKNKSEVIRKFKVEEFITKHVNESEWALKNGLITSDQHEDFLNVQLPKAINDGYKAEVERSNSLNRFENNHLTKFKDFFIFKDDVQKRRIVFISRGFPPENNGGIAQFVKTLAYTLPDFANVHVITETKKNIEYIDYNSGVWIHYIFPWKGVPNISGLIYTDNAPVELNNWSYSALAEVIRIKSRMHVDVVECPIWDAEGISFVLNKSILGNTRIVTSLHTTFKHYIKSNINLLESLEWKSNFYDKIVSSEVLQLKNSDGIRANSNAIVKSIEEEYKISLNKSRLKVINHGLNSKFNPKFFKKLDDKQSIAFLYVGRLESRKGIDTLLEAIPLFFDKCQQFDCNPIFKIVGKDDSCTIDSSFSSHSEYFCKTYKDRFWYTNVIFTGVLTEEELINEYNSCDVFVAPSRFESFGLIFVEAMSCGKPVIGTNVGGIPEVVANNVNGILVEPEDVNMLSQSFIRMLDEKLRSDYGTASKNIYLEKFTSNRMAENSVNFFNSICDKDLRIVIAHSVLAKNDGVSNIILEHINELNDNHSTNIEFVGYRCDYDHLQSTIIKNTCEFLSSPAIQSADIIIFHYAIYYDFFESIKELYKSKAIYVVFHNVTPPNLVSQENLLLILKSFKQIDLFNLAKKIYCISKENINVLKAYKIHNLHSLPIGPGNHSKIYAYNLANCQKKSHKDVDNPISILFIGRIVYSKGCVDLIEALNLVLNKIKVNLSLNIITNLDFADKNYLTNFMVKLDELRNNKSVSVSFIDGCGDDAKYQILHDSDIFVLPSYHEGYGIPLIEAFSCGNHVIGYDNSNIKNLLNGAGVLVQTAAVDLLCNAIIDQIGHVIEERKSFSKRMDYIESCNRHIHTLLEGDDSRFLNDLINNYEATLKPIAKSKLLHPVTELQEICEFGDFQALQSFNRYQFYTFDLLQKNIYPGSTKWKEKTTNLFALSDNSYEDINLFKDNISTFYSNGWCLSNFDSACIGFNAAKNPIDVFWGPYLNLPVGSYIFYITAELEVNPNAIIRVLVTANSGSNVVFDKVFEFNHQFAKSSIVLINECLTFEQHSVDIELKIILEQGSVLFFDVDRSVFLSC